MSQKANTYLILPELSEELIASEPWSIETYADGLMDELFAEIDLILEGSDSLPFQTPPQDSIRQVQTVTVPQIVVPETQLRSLQNVPKPRNNPLSTVVVGTPAVSRPINKPQKKSQHTTSIVLWMGVTIGLAAASVFWVLHSGLLNRLVSQSLQQSLLQPQALPQPQLPTKAQVEADLVNYMLGALAVIDKQEARSHLRSAKPVLTATAPANQTALAYITPTDNLPVPVAANNLPPVPNQPIPNQPTRVVERIYIPVYQAPQPMRYAPPPIAGTSNPLPQVATVPKKTLSNASKPASVIASNNASNNVSNNAQQLAKPRVQALAAVRPEPKPMAIAQPVTVPQVTQPVPVQPGVPSNAAPAPSYIPEKHEVASGVTTPEITSASHTLEGLLELGNKSAALFKINGVTRRIEVGEAIGSSGWTLVEVTNGEALIRRNGEVRSIYTGQTF
ncbi:hypothetical protein BZZ01_08635 [Nostocales cyanobacterium HT-58-2]|nr:hypothetical protein BZZ01_08635 [Nostocales cyanobacterium HT-58-2]